MKRVEFKSYRQYVEAQKKEVNKKGLGPFFTDVECHRIAEWLKNNSGIKTSVSGVCHGARNGLESDVLSEGLEKYYDSVNVFGTDLFPYSGKSANRGTVSSVVKCNFSIRNKKWVRQFDLVYSNSLDHARDPVQTLQVWFEQLKSAGHLFIQWSPSHRKARRGDCFGAELHEYISIINSIGIVRDLLYIKVKRGGRLRRRANEVIVIVAGKS